MIKIESLVSILGCLVFYLLLSSFVVENIEAASFADPIAGIKMVLVKGGCYQTFPDGHSGKPAEKVCLDDFYLSQYEVTQDQWKRVKKNAPSYYAYCGGNCPVENVSWNDVQEFIGILNKLTGKRYRLPTEAEWEYAARSRGKNEKWAGTDDEGNAGDFAWYAGNSEYLTQPVGQKKPNSLGFYDMTGNAAEWVSNWHSGGYLQGYNYETTISKNPTGPPKGRWRVVRGGDCGSSLQEARTSARFTQESDVRCSSCTIGFRLAISAKK